MDELNRSIFSGMQILIEQKWMKNQAVVVEDNIIKAIIAAEMIEHHLPAKRHEFPEDCYLIPGMIDLHIHGVHGKDVMDGSEEALVFIGRSLAREGVTGFLATTMTADNDHLEAVLKMLPAAMPVPDGAAILGVHLEGPFIAKAKSGAQQSEYTQVPDIDLIKRWQKMANGAIKLVTLAPELPEAINFIKELHEMGVIASVGHTNATYKETCEAITAGCTQATHLFNAMNGLHHRAPGAVGALLLADEVTAELIVDGLHLAPAIAELALRIKGKDRLLLVTDAMRAKCLGDGQYELGGQHVNVTAGKAVLADGTLAGSTLRMPQAVKNMTKFSKCSLEHAIHMASHNPAKVLGLLSRKGTITVSKDADLVVLDAKLDVMLTMREGRVVYSSSR